MQRHSRQQPRWAAVLITVCAAIGLAGADPPEEPPIDPIEKQLKRIGALITNAGSRLRNGIVGMDSSGQSASSTAARRCCSKNIERIEQSLVVLEQKLTERKACYEESGNPTAAATIDFSMRDIEAFRAAFNAFVLAPDNQVLPTLSSLTKPYGDMRHGLQGLQPCPAPDPEGKKKEGKNKKKPAG